MTAKEMFEELGYYKIEKNSKGIKLTMVAYYNDETASVIEFWTPKNIKIDIYNNEYLTVEHIKAINKQIEELGWDNE